MNSKVIKRTIIVSWVVLFVCFAIKLCGGEWFNIVATNSGLITACNAAEQRPVLNYIVLFIIYYTGLILCLLAILGRKWFTQRQFWVTTIFLIAMWIIKLCVTIYLTKFSVYINTVLDILVAFMFPWLFYKAKWYRCLISLGFYLLFGFIIMFTKNLSLTETIDCDLLVTIIYSIDYFIMLFLYYLYSNLLRKEKH